MIHIWTAVVDESEEWSAQLISNLRNGKEEAWKNQGFNRIRTRNLREYRCDALPTELWRHKLGARSIYWVISPARSEMMWSTYEIIHTWTAFVDESEEWSSQLISIWAIGKKKPEKIRASTGFEPWPPRYQCDALPTEIWSHTLGARSIPHGGYELNKFYI